MSGCVTFICQRRAGAGRCRQTCKYNRKHLTMRSSTLGYPSRPLKARVAQLQLWWHWPSPATFKTRLSMTTMSVRHISVFGGFLGVGEDRVLGIFKEILWMDPQLLNAGHNCLLHLFLITYTSSYTSKSSYSLPCESILLYDIGSSSPVQHRTSQFPIVFNASEYLFYCLNKVQFLHLRVSRTIHWGLWLWAPPLKHP